MLFNRAPDVFGKLHNSMMNESRARTQRRYKRRRNFFDQEVSIRVEVDGMEMKSTPGRRLG
jgi:hypothetical protein